MKLIPVESSNIKAVGYDPATKEMHVQFAGGDTYAHFDVEAIDHARFIAAESKGSHYHRTFRNKFGVKKLPKTTKVCAAHRSG